VAGIDICEDEDSNYRVIEVNMTPAFTWPHMQSVDKVVQMILRRLAEQA
jgi:glutathione synthase/RimK-type ligase-like ATP-grasp enzyme